MNQKLETLLQMALQTPEEVRVRTEELNVGFNGETQTWEVIVKYHGNLDELEVLNIQVEYLIAGYAILTVPESLVELVSEYEQIEYLEKPKRYFYEEMVSGLTAAEAPTEDSCVMQVTLREPNLTGAGVLVAVIDSGIDFTRSEFRNGDGSTRIRYLWDQTLQPSVQGRETPSAAAEDISVGGIVSEKDGTVENEQIVRRPPTGFRQGVEFDSAQINLALAAGTQQQQFQRLPSIDTSGHGTAVAGIAAGNSGTYQGIAPEAEFLIVKLGVPEATSFPRTTEIMRAVTYVVNKAIELQMPVVINLSFGNTYGAHDGSSLLERFLDNAAEIGRTVICVGSGNEGANGGHVAGSLRQGQSLEGSTIPYPASVELAVAEYEQSLSIQLWKNYNDVYRIVLRAPGGGEVNLPGTINGGKYTLELEQTEILVYIGEPQPYAVAQEIYLELLPRGRNYINSGVWTIRLEPQAAEALGTGNYYFYLPSSTVRSIGTGFYRPTPDVTLTIPATAAKVITVGAYDSTYDAYADFSGRGYADYVRTIGVITAGLAKPDLVAPGVGITAPDIYGEYGTFTGTSFATPIVAGSVALLMEWGIVRGNNIFLYGEKVKAYLRKGAQPLRGETVYPNERVGWGKLCVAESLQL